MPKFPYSILQRMEPAERRLLAWGALALVLSGAVLPAVIRAAEPEEDFMGLTEYEIACMPCHGVDAKGNGPQAKSLRTPPADLTRIAAKNGGVFPDREIYDIIDGRGVIDGHGTREMPVWGSRYRATTEANEGKEDAEKRVRALIDALVGYLATIQEK